MLQRISLALLCILVLLNHNGQASYLPHSHTEKHTTDNLKNVLVLHSYNPGLASTDAIMAGLQETFALAENTPLLHIEYLDTKRHPDPEYFTHVLDAILHYKLEQRSFDLVVVSGNEALNFALEHRDILFTNTPIVFTAIESYAGERLQNTTWMTGIAQEPDYQGMIAQAKIFHPDAERAIILGHTLGVSDQLAHDKLQTLTRDNELFHFEHWYDLSHQDLTKKLAALGPKDIIFISGQMTDRNGNLPCFLSPNPVTFNLRAPVYSPHRLFFGHGTVGGQLINSRVQGELAAEMALEILAGRSPAELPVVTPLKSLPQFDYQQLQKHRISEELLPVGAELTNKPQDDVYPIDKTLVQASIACLLLSIAIIFFLSTNYLRRTKAERLYRELSQQFQIILEGLPDSLTLVSPEMKVIWSNKGGAEYLNRQLGTAPGEYCCKLLYDKNSLCEKCPAVDSLQTGERSEAVITSPAGNILEVKAFPLKDQQGKIESIILLASDITEKNRLREEAIRASRLASLGELAAGVAHEINNPNALILLNSELLHKAYAGAAPILQKYYEQHGNFDMGSLKYSDLQAELPHLFDELRDGANRIKNIVNDLKDFARNDSPDQNDQVDLNEVVKTAVRLINNTIKNSTNNLYENYSEPLPILSGNFQRIEQVIVNLLINSCQALPDKEKSIKINSSYISDNNMLCLEVSDEGIGIQPEHLEHITEPFFTTKRKEGGTGLGLSVASRIIADHKGIMNFHSQPGAGTRVELLLPAATLEKLND